MIKIRNKRKTRILPIARFFTTCEISAFSFSRIHIPPRKTGRYYLLELQDPRIQFPMYVDTVLNTKVQK